MNKSIFKYVILLSLILCFIPLGVSADNEVSGSFTVVVSKIIDLAVIEPTYTTLNLTWTSPTNSINWGPATQYDIRYSLSPITNDSEWLAATVLSGVPVPKPPGSHETLLIVGLNSCTTYYFAIKAADSTGEWTPLSNSPYGTTLCTGGGGGGGGDIGGLPGSLPGCPLSLTADVQGNITIASMTNDGVLCEVCLAKDISGKNSLELEKGTKLALAGNIAPALIKVTTSPSQLPVPANTKIVSPVYELNAYASARDNTPSPVVITPSARLILNYEPAQLPEGATEGYIANYTETQGWISLEPGPGVAELGKAHCLINHFSLYAVLARAEQPATAKFTVSNLTINPSQAQLQQTITISVDISNTGETSSDYAADLKIDGAVKSSTQITVAPGDSQAVAFTITADALGKHKVEISDLVGEFEVVAAASPSSINWWLIGSILGIVAVVVIWSILGWKWYQDHKKPAVISKEKTPKSD
ncbi:MAG TPA: CARDB domain-containing protein [Dehalococcoidia bacterium]|jgi:hypothetical protein